MKAILYLGLEVPEHLNRVPVIHCPLIQIIPRPKEDQGILSAFAAFTAYTHLIFTSKSAVSIFMDYAPEFGVDLEAIRSKCIVAIGQRTAAKLAAHHAPPCFIADEETAEGVVKMLRQQDLKGAYVFWPHSALARPTIPLWLQQQNIRYCACPLYDTLDQALAVIPDATLYNEIVFTSPSTVDAFLKIHPFLPFNKTLTCIGPITYKYLQKHLKKILEKQNGL